MKREGLSANISSGSSIEVTSWLIDYGNSVIFNFERYVRVVLLVLQRKFGSFQNTSSLATDVHFSELVDQLALHLIFFLENLVF